MKSNYLRTVTPLANISQIVKQICLMANLATLSRVFLFQLEGIHLGHHDTKFSDLKYPLRGMA